MRLWTFEDPSSLPRLELVRDAPLHVDATGDRGEKQLGGVAVGRRPCSCLGRVGQRVFHMPQPGHGRLGDVGDRFGAGSGSAVHGRGVRPDQWSACREDVEAGHRAIVKKAARCQTAAVAYLEP